VIAVASYVGPDGGACAGRCARYVAQADVKEASGGRDGPQCPSPPVPALSQHPAAGVPDRHAPGRRRARYPGKAAVQRPRIVARVHPPFPVPAVRQRLPEAGLTDRGALSGRRARHAHQQAIARDGLDSPSGAVPCLRQPGPGELSRQPAYALRTAWTSSFRGQPLTFGAAGYYSRQDWPYEHYVDGWAGMADWQIPLAARLSFTGEFYRGRAIGGIGGDISQSVVYDGNPKLAGTSLRGLDTIGGWSQLKLKATNTLEFNVAAGLDNPTTSEVRGAAASQPYLFVPLFVQNRGALVNVVFRPRSSLLFSGEYGRLRTTQLNDVSNSADQISLIMGILF